MATADSKRKKKQKTPRPNMQAFPKRWRRKATALAAGFILLAAGALYSGIWEKLSGNVAATPAKNPPVAGYRVAEVVDGDTLVLRASSGKNIRVRLYGVDAPELHQNGGKASTKFTASLLRSETVSFQTLDTDQYGRKVALIFLQDGRTVNEELVKAGHAWVYRAHCHEEPMCSSWYKHERLAQKEGRGLWRGGNPLPPWRWREQNPRK